VSNSRRLIFPHPKRVLLLGSILIVALVVATFAYLTSLPPRIGPQASIVSSPIEFSIEMEKTDFQQGENINVTLSLTNTSNKTITLLWGSYYAEWGQRIYFDYYIVNANGTKVYQYSHERGYLASTVEKVLNPGDQIANFYNWYQICADPSGNYAIAPKGTYSVVGLTRRILITVDGKANGVSLATPSIDFTIK